LSKFLSGGYLPVGHYEEALGALHGAIGILLFEFAKEEREKRDIIIRNQIARTDMMARSIFRLWSIEDYQDCWILHRCLMERLFHLFHLRENGQFEEFEAWSFLEQYNAINRVRSDPDFAKSPVNRLLLVTPEQKKRARNLCKAPPKWQRPKAEDVAKSMDLRFLYRYGYDYASRHVHPMADDGLRDFHTITRLEPAPDFPDERAVLSNTLLVATMVVQEGLNASTMSWRALVYDFLDHLRRFLGNGVDDYKATFVQLARAFEQHFPLCQSPAERR